YAEVTYNGLPEADGRRLLFGWLRQTPSEARSWTGAQSLPREVTLRTIQGRLELCQQPARELGYLRRHHRVLTDRAIVDELTLVPEAGIEAGACELALEAEIGDAAELALHLSTHGEATLTVGYDVRAGLLFVDGAGESRQAVPWAPAAGRIVWRVFVDQTIVEVYAGQGERVISSVITPDVVVERVALDAQGGVAHLVKLEAWSLDSALLTTPW
ncbi:MAG: GH32 C-terminal domain-containing protein, partial [Anaerolineae bacterium]|nr:GH32 C-terminal domain-containing protein [Anaerolineae bacterium]